MYVLHISRSINALSSSHVSLYYSVQSEHSSCIVLLNHSYMLNHKRCRRTQISTNWTRPAAIGWMSWSTNTQPAALARMDPPWLYIHRCGCCSFYRRWAPAPSWAPCGAQKTCLLNVPLHVGVAEVAGACPVQIGFVPLGWPGWGAPQTRCSKWSKSWLWLSLRSDE